MDPRAVLERLCKSHIAREKNFGRLWKTGHQTDGCNIVVIQGRRMAQREPQVSVGQWAE